MVTVGIIGAGRIGKVHIDLMHYSGKDIYGAVKPWVIYAISWNGKNYYHRVSGHFDYESALKVFTILQGKEWLGGETLSDQC